MLGDLKSFAARLTILLWYLKQVLMMGIPSRTCFVLSILKSKLKVYIQGYTYKVVENGRQEKYLVSQFQVDDNFFFYLQREM